MMAPHRPFAGRERLLAELVERVGRLGQNVVLVGHAGVGKSALVEALINCTAPDACRVYPVAREDRLADVILEAGRLAQSAAPTKIVLEFSDLGLLARRFDLDPLFAEARATGFQILAFAYPDLAYLLDRSAHDDAFELIRVPEPTDLETIAMVEAHRAELADVHGVEICPEAVIASVRWSFALLSPTERQPAAAIRALDRVATGVSRRSVFDRVDDMTGRARAALDQGRDTRRLRRHARDDARRPLGGICTVDVTAFEAQSIAFELARQISQDYYGPPNLIADLARTVADWLSEPIPRFPLRLLFVGSVSVGRGRLAQALADALFRGRIIEHAWQKERDLVQTVERSGFGTAPVVLQLGPLHGKEREELTAMLRTGGLRLGNERFLDLANSIVVACVHAETMAQGGPEWLPSHAELIDARFDLPPLDADCLHRVLRDQYALLEETRGRRVRVTESAAAWLAHETGGSAAASWHEISGLVSELVFADASVGLETSTVLVTEEHGELIARRMERTAPPPKPPEIELPVGRSSLKTTERPASFPALRWTTRVEFDVFVSYKRKRDASAARSLVARLRRRGYLVWFDEDFIDPTVERSHSAILEKLTSALLRSRCTVVFAIDPELAESSTTEIGPLTRLDRSGMPWSWQGAELDASARLIVIHPDSRIVTSSGRRLVRIQELEERPAEGTNLTERIVAAVRYFCGARRS